MASPPTARDVTRTESQRTWPNLERPVKPRPARVARWPGAAAAWLSLSLSLSLSFSRAAARAAQASQGAGSALFPPHKVPWRLSAVSPFVDPAQLHVLHQPVHALHKRFTCVRWLTPLLDGTLTLHTPHFRSLVRAPYVHLMTKKMTPQPKVVDGPPSGHFARLSAHRASSS